MTDTRTAPTVRPAPLELSLAELDRYANAELEWIRLAEEELSKSKTRALSLKRVIHKARNPELELEGKQ